MAELMLVNPRKRRAKKARSPAQRAATKRMLAANRSRRGSSTKRRAKRSTAVARRRSNPIGLSRVSRRVSRRTRRSNPIALGGIARGATAMFMPALQGAGGALLVNTAINYMGFLPPMFKSGNGKYLARAGLAIAIGTIGSKVLPGRVASNMAVGALTVAMHDMILGIASQAMPTLQLGDVGDFDTGVNDFESLSYYPQEGMGDIYSPTEVGEYVNA